ncbi:MAG: ATP-binding protein, partial [bacterium]|nr:ATP-binding protein [bacterium]
TPVVVMNDEADLADAQRDAPKGDSGVSERLMKMWMEFLSDPRIRGQVVVISCTNRPDRIDPALKRSGRGDQRILIPMPSMEELPDIFRVMFKRYNIPTGIKNFLPFAQKTDGLSGADVEAIVLNAFRFASGETVDEASLNRAIEDFIPSASQAAIDFMTMVGLLECSSRLLLPPNTEKIVQGIAKRNLIENLENFMAQIKARKIIEL